MNEETFSRARCAKIISSFCLLTSSLKNCGLPRTCTVFSPVKSRDFTVKVCNPNANTKAELNRRSQACESPGRHRCSRREKKPKRTESGTRPLLRPCGVSADRPDSLGKMDGHESNALSIPVWKTGVYLSTPMPEEIEVVCWNGSRVSGFADRSLSCFDDR